MQNWNKKWENVSLIANRAYLQEPTSEKTNNGIHYKLQLLYSNGKSNVFILILTGRSKGIIKIIISFFNNKPLSYTSNNMLSFNNDMNSYEL